MQEKDARAAATCFDAAAVRPTRTHARDGWYRSSDAGHAAESERAASTSELVACSKQSNSRAGRIECDLFPSRRIRFTWGLGHNDPNCGRCGACIDHIRGDCLLPKGIEGPEPKRVESRLGVRSAPASYILLRATGSSS